MQRNNLHIVAVDNSLTNHVIALITEPKGITGRLFHSMRILSISSNGDRLTFSWRRNTQRTDNEVLIVAKVSFQIIQEIHGSISVSVVAGRESTDTIAISV